MSLAGLDLNLLKVFDALLREGSTVKAGQRIGLSQPAVSAALGRLRVALKDDLFVRHGQGLAPTEFARELELPLRETLDQLESLLASPLAWDPATATDVLRLSGMDFWAELLLPRLAKEVMAEAPGMRLQLLDLVPDASVASLEDHRIDLALMPLLGFPGHIESTPLFRSPFAVLARAGHPRLQRAGLGAGDTVPLDLFCDLDHVLLSPDGKLQAAGDAKLAEMGRSRRVALTVPFFSAVATLVRTTDAIALMPEQYARHAASAGQLLVLQPPFPAPEPTLCMIWHRRLSRSPAHRWLREKIARIAAETLVLEGQDDL